MPILEPGRHGHARWGIPGRWWTHYLNSNADMRAYAAMRGVPASPGEKTLEIANWIHGAYLGRRHRGHPHDRPGRPWWRTPAEADCATSPMSMAA